MPDFATATKKLGGAMLASTALAVSLSTPPAITAYFRTYQRSGSIAIVASFGVEKPEGAYTISARKERRVDMCDLKTNLDRLVEFSALKEDWDYNGAYPISFDLLKDVRSLLYQLHVQPRLVPTPCGGVQLEYKTPARDYLESELRPSEETVVLCILSGQAPQTRQISFTVESINKVVDEFYAEAAKRQ